VIRLSCHLESAIGRHELGDYVRELVIDVLGANDEGIQEILVGRLAISQILWADAQMEGQSLLDVCDADSQGLYEMFEMLTDGNEEGQIRDDLKVEEPFDHIMFLYRAVFHPSLAPYRQAIVEAAVNLLGSQALIVMWLETGGFPESELADLGFKKIATTSLIYRNLAFTTKFIDRHPQGMDGADYVAQPEYEVWVHEQWGDDEP
jgi:hypothetical protein